MIQHLGQEGGMENFIRSWEQAVGAGNLLCCQQDGWFPLAAHLLLAVPDSARSFLPPPFPCWIS